MAQKVIEKIVDIKNEAERVSSMNLRTWVEDHRAYHAIYCGESLLFQKDNVQECLENEPISLVVN